ncbi:prepilin-type N-terminal cleavage/methylation domain-containing protein [Trichococcus ilyis]|jgi:prepilin-type N-terminal cleavage/methylation domain-containing protein|uniref:prepilin-type N-terminal cleavage/methylation domain-containing protein n=1 Tax=Trichococcus ilyis TaxID=640938 RepID=UPI0008384D52|nr:prepilin-type N-terminal cleavage/methylation domain-containing protein [Trichococcus ilyis]
MRKSGFTLFESLLVLAIASLILLLTPRLDTAMDEFAFTLFLDDFLTELHTAQSYAVITGNGVNMDVARPIGATHYAVFKDGSVSDRYANRKLLLPEGARVIQGYTGFIKGGSGYLQPNTIIMETARSRYTITIQLGSGRYEINKAAR